MLPLHLCPWPVLPVLYPSTVSFSSQFLSDLRTILPSTPNAFLWWCTKQVNIYCRLKSGSSCLQVITLEYKIQFVLEGDKESEWRCWNYFLGWTWRTLDKSFCLNIAEVFSQDALELEMVMVSLWTHSRCFAECISTLELRRTLVLKEDLSASSSNNSEAWAVKKTKPTKQQQKSQPFLKCETKPLIWQNLCHISGLPYVAVTELNSN